MIVLAYLGLTVGLIGVSLVSVLIGSCVKEYLTAAIKEKNVFPKLPETQPSETIMLFGFLISVTAFIGIMIGLVYWVVWSCGFVFG